MKKRMKKQMISCILILAMVISLMPVTTKQAFAAEDVITVDTASRKIFANGNAIILQAGTTAGYTNIIIDSNRDGSVDAGENAINLNSSDYFDGTLTGTDTTTGFLLSKVRIYGGGNERPVTGDTKITMLGGEIEIITGGGYASSPENSAAVSGNSYIEVYGGKVDCIFGGGERLGAPISGNTNVTLKGGSIRLVRGGGVGGCSVLGSTNLLIEGATITSSIYGGGVSSSATGTGTGGTVNASYITVNDGSSINEIYGGGDYGGKILTSTNITINGGKILGRIFGGGDVSGSDVGSSDKGAECNVTINGGTFEGFNKGIFGGGKDTKVYGNTHITINNGTLNSHYKVYGGGFSANSSADVIGNTSILVYGGAISSICGSADTYYSSYSATVSGASITVSGGTVGQISLGGGEDDKQASSASATITGGTITNIYKGFVSGSAQLTYTGGTISGEVDEELSRPVAFTGLTANGALGTSTTTELTLTFSEDPISLTASNITVTGATKGTLSGTGTTRTLNISDITVGSGQNVTVTVATPAAFTITPSSKTVAVYKYVPTLTNIDISTAEVEDKDRAVAGTKVADLAVTGTPTTGITYALDGSGYDNNLFQIDKTELQIAAGAVLSARSYTVQVTATETAKPINTVTKTISFTPNIKDTTPPTVTSIVRKTPSTESTNASSVTYTVNFSESVDGVDISDFAITTTGTADATIASVSSVSGKTVDVTVNSIAGQGTLRLDLKATGTGIVDTAGNAIAGGYTGGQTYTVDRIAPTVTSIKRLNPSTEGTNASSVIYQVTFSEIVSGVDISDFVLTGTGTASAYIALVSSSINKLIDVTVTSIAGQGTIRLDLKASGTGIKDKTGNAIAGGFTEGETYTVDRIAPKVTSITRKTSSDQDTNASSLTFTVNFSESVNGVDAGDFTLTTTGDASGSIASVSSSSGSVIDVTVNTGAGSGAIRLDLKATGTGIKDTTGNDIGGGFTEGETYSVDRIAPKVTSITRKTSSDQDTNASSLTFTVNFSESVNGVDADDFTLTTTGTASGSIASVSSSSGSTIDVTVNTGAGSGAIRLDLKATGTGIKDTTGNDIGGGFTEGETYSVDRIAPKVTSITRLNPLTATTSASSGSLTYRVTFGESVDGVDAGDFTLTKTGLADASIASVSSASGSTIDVIVNTGTGDGTLRLDLNSIDTGITDLIGNAIAGGYTNGETYTVDQTAPTLTAGAVARTSDTSATVKFTSTEAGKYYYVVVASGAVQQIIDTSGAGANCSAAENTITLLTLSAGAKDIYVVVKDAVDNVSADTFKISIPAYVAPPSNGGGDGGNGNGGNGGGNNDDGATDNSKNDLNQAVEIRINDIVVNAGSKVEAIVEGKMVTTVSVDEKMIKERITAEGKKAVITIPINSTASDVLVAELNGQMVKNLEQNAAVIEVKTDAATYILPAKQINIENISKKLGTNPELSDIKVKVEIAKPSIQTNALVENAVNQDEFTVVAPPVDFTVSCTYGKETVAVSKFNNYVARTVAIPEAVDAKRITTGVIVEANGTVRHIPTKVEVIDGKYYAKINSLTNSTYAVIWNPITYKDVKNNSTGKAINDLGSRMVISGAKKDSFRPDSKITRAEFVAMLVTSLGLEPGTEDTLYKDVKLKDWYSKYIEAANEYGIISGSAKAKFRPKDKITTEEAMTMLNNAMKLTELKVKFKKDEAKKLLAGLAKTGKTQEWSDNSMAVCMKAGIVAVKSNQKIAPKDKLTRAEAAVMIRKLLVKSNLI